MINLTEKLVKFLEQLNKLFSTLCAIILSVNFIIVAIHDTILKVS